MKILSRSSLGPFFLTVLLLWLGGISVSRADWVAGAPHPQNVLVIYISDDTFGNQVMRTSPDLLDTFNGTDGSGLAFNVTSLPILKSDADGFSDELTAAGLTLDQFDQVWDVRFVNTACAAGVTQGDTISAADMTNFTNYLTQGGSLFLLGENAGFHCRDDNLISYLNSTVNNGSAIPYPVTAPSTAYPIDPTNAALAENLNTDFWSITGPDTTFTGEFPYTGGTGSGLAVTKYNDTTNGSINYTMAIAFDHSQLQPAVARGKLYVNMDYNMFASGMTTNSIQYVANIADFLTPDAIIQLTKSAGPKTLQVGTNVTYTIVATNNGPTSLTTFRVDDTLPSGLSYVSASPSPNQVSGNYLEWNMPDTAGHASVTISIVANAFSAPATENVSCNCAEGWSPSTNPPNVSMLSNCEPIAVFNYSAGAWASYLGVEHNANSAGSSDQLHLYPLIDGTTLTMTQTNTTATQISSTAAPGISTTTVNSGAVLDSTLSAGGFNFFKVATNYPMLWEFNTWGPSQFTANKGTMVLGGNGSYSSQYFITHLSPSIGTYSTNAAYGDAMVAVNTSAVTTTAIVEYTLDNGATWHFANSVDIAPGSATYLRTGTNTTTEGDYRVFSCQGKLEVFKGEFLNSAYADTGGNGFLMGGGADGCQASTDWIYGAEPYANRQLVVTAITAVSGYTVQEYVAGPGTGNTTFSGTSGTWTTVYSGAALAAAGSFTVPAANLGGNSTGSGLYRVKATSGTIRAAFGGSMVDSGNWDEGDIVEGDNCQWYSNSFTFGTHSSRTDTTGVDVSVPLSGVTVNLSPFGGALAGTSANGTWSTMTDEALRYRQDSSGTTTTKTLTSTGGNVFVVIGGNNSKGKSYSGPPFIQLVTNTPTNTPTQTQTATPTNSPTRTPTYTPTYSPTNSPTLTPTSSPTNSPTNTATKTPTSTATQTPTNSPTATPTNSATNSPTNSPSATPTNSATATATRTSTSTATQTATSTPSVTATNTATATPSRTATSTATATPTSTASPTPTNSATSTASSTPTNSATSTATRTATNSATSTPTQSATASPTKTATGTPTATPTNTFLDTPTNTATNSASATPTSSSTNSPTNTATSSATSTATRTATNSATSTPTQSATASPTNTATGTPTATPTNTYLDTPTNTATNSASATPTNSSTNSPTNTPTRTATMTATNSPSATPTDSPTSTATSTSTNTSTSTSTLTQTSTATFTATSTPTSTASPTPTDSATSTASRTATSTFTSSPTGTPSWTPSSTATPTVTDTPVPSATATSTPTDTGTSTASSTPTDSATPSPTRTFTSSATSTPTFTPSSTATLTASWTTTATPTSTPSATSSQTPSSSPTQTSSWTATNSPVPSATDTWTFTVTATWTFSSTPSMTATSSATSTPSSTPTVTSTGTPTRTATSTATSTASATPSSTATVTSSFTPTSSPTLTPTRTSTSTPTATSTWTFTPTITPTFTVTSTPTNTPVVGDVFYVSLNKFDPAQGPVSIHVEYNKSPGAYSLWIYNTAGEHIRTLDNSYLMAPVIRDYTWDGRNKYGDICASGIYIFYLVEPRDVKHRRILLIR